MKSWTMFLISIGFLVVALAPQAPVPIIQVVVGLVLVLIGVILMKRKK